MKFKITRRGLVVSPESGTGFEGNSDERDLAYIEDTLGLKTDGDAVMLVRRNAIGLSSIAYLETMTVPDYHKYLNDKAQREAADKARQEDLRARKAT